MSTRQSLESRHVVVTGAGNGIGRATALEAARRGARVTVVDVEADSAASVADEVRRLGGHAFAVACDVRDADACEAAVAAAREALGPVDVLVNNAGISHRSLFADTELAVVRQVLDVNFFGAVHFTGAALDDLRARAGVVVAISSVAGFAPLLGRTAYSASKHALHGFFDSLRSELRGDGVGVVLVCPSFTRTRIDEAALDGRGRALGAERTTVGGMSSPEDIAGAILDGVERRTPLVLTSPVGRASWWISRVAPRLYERLMTRTQGADDLGTR